PTSIVATSPPEPVGMVDVHVTTRGGTSPTVVADQFKYRPTVSGVSPNSGPAEGGTAVTVSGTGFRPGATIFRFASMRATSVECASSTNCKMVAPEIGRASCRERE